jgi:hypothetical protein
MRAGFKDAAPGPDILGNMFGQLPNSMKHASSTTAAFAHGRFVLIPESMMTRVLSPAACAGTVSSDRPKAAAISSTFVFIFFSFRLLVVG